MSPPSPSEHPYFLESLKALFHTGATGATHTKKGHVVRPSPYEVVQQAHDALIREHVRRHSWYEIGTQGDSFELAFKSVEAAVLFCVEVQEELREMRWSSDVLALPSCHPEHSRDGLFSIVGPRVRMGLHLARKGTYTRHMHDLTRTTTYDGPAWKVTKELADSGHGGQVLATAEACAALDWQAAYNPAVEHLGKYTFTVGTTGG